jgi:hypothetical protein
MACLASGHLTQLIQTVRQDYDLNLEIRDGFLNIYFKGHSLLKLSEGKRERYTVAVHKKFTHDLDLPQVLDNQRAVEKFVNCIPKLKQNILQNGKGSLEIEYEQMIIRANNYEPRNNSEYFIVDRQYTVDVGRFDLTGFYWDRRARRKGQEVSPCLMEVKFALNQDIREVHEQLVRYYNALRPIASQFAEEQEMMLRQKLALGLYCQSQDRLDAMKTLVFSRDIAQFQFILILVDYNPNSAKFDPEKLSTLPFADQIKIFQGGFGMWRQNVDSIINR